MTLEENLQLLRSTKQNIKTALNDKIHESADNKPFVEYHSIVDGFKQGSNNIDDYTITDTTRLSEYTGDSFTLLTHIKSVNIPTTVTSLGNSCFNGCTSLSAITIPNTVTSIGDYCFNDCSSLMGITIPNSVTSIPKYCFNYCSSLTSVTIPNSVTSLGDSCFRQCSGLTSVTIPDSVTSLVKDCFINCSGLTEITIPEYVTSIGQGCFAFCSKLTSVTCKATTPPTFGIMVFSTTPISTIYVPSESVDAYKSATNWSTYADKIQAMP